jgi:nucleotide-binding universal stress UspA family protein
MKRIIVAVDGSEEAQRAARMAVDLARQFDAPLSLIHVVPPMPYPYEDYGLSKHEVHETNRQAAEVLMRKAREALGDLKVPVDQRILWGSPSEQIIEAANEPDVDLVVVGNRGRNAVARVMLGSTSNRIVNACTKPVLVVR